MLVVTRFSVPEGEGESFSQSARTALSALSARPGYRGGRLGRAADDPTAWVLTTEWQGVGAYRRALSAYEVRTAATPLLSRGCDEPSAYEVLYADGPGAPATGPSRRARDV
ncbi:MAG: antibiotic biosynthesis monooxygenase family protein [Mycobacteriales bacterium]